MSKWASVPSAGYDSIEQEFEASLRRAFVDHRADFIIIDDRRQRFRGESATFGEERGWLNGRLVQLDDQTSEIRYRLTESGRAHFGLEADAPAKETRCSE
jgi:hypothetical protein